MDFSEASSNNVTAQDIAAVADKLQNGSWIVVNTGWSRFFSNPDLATSPYINGWNFPGVSLAAIDKLIAIENRKGIRINGIAIDNLGIDSGEGQAGIDENVHELVSIARARLAARLEVHRERHQPGRARLGKARQLHAGGRRAADRARQRQSGPRHRHVRAIANQHPRNRRRSMKQRRFTRALTAAMLACAPLAAVAQTGQAWPAKPHHVRRAVHAGRNDRHRRPHHQQRSLAARSASR